MGFMKTPDEDETSNLIWCDSAVQQEKIAELQNYQVGINRDRLLVLGEFYEFHHNFTQIGFLMCGYIKFHF